ncbi:MAG: SH3 domain-containing protein [Candidatus Peribacter sp.]|mgnify:FL=1|jgi:hypothetical protein|nr:SH3 domain-containing protein [Candidatus Peribacter sp.]MBT4392718.1 SH3 domain-containing protein [Candidatus Peribacter sp.]MBT4600665.1 SH3 domain-containing protein [Candidatus Peribacter sp.]MBT5148666.1 SH3 domain-containing protein [Candidatus Peribacter sp.]MBT5637739.1 SH3 domain-containing protein [Candidatus Peribacter sp.]
MAYYSSSRRSSTPRPFVGFLLVASFGILFAGCGGSEQTEIPQAEDFSFTADDLARVKELVGDGSGAFIPRLELAPEQEGVSGPPVIDVGSINKFNAMRTASDGQQDMFRVTNAFLNVRSNPKVTATQIGRLDRSEAIQVLEFVDAAWAKVLLNGEEGYVASRYIGKLVSETQLAEEKKKYEGMYYVDFGFLNVRKETDANSEKLGELAGQSFVRPLTKDEVWARIPFNDGDGYVASQYLTPFLPNFLVRQGSFNLPVVHFKLASEGILEAMPEHITALKNGGYTIWTMSDFYQLLLKQEEKDVRLNPNTVILAVSDITKENVNELSSVLRSGGIDATLFLEGRMLSGGIDQKQLMTLIANGHDLQTAGHTGDDLRSLTNAQVELELSQSKQLLEQITKKKVISVAYPLGGVNDRIARKAGEVGYLLGLSLAPDTRFERTQLLRMPSFVIKASTSSDDLLSLVSQ